MTQSVLGVGFIGLRFCELYPDWIPESHGRTASSYDDVLYTRSTTTNYYPLRGDTTTDIEVNLVGLGKVLPNVRGRFTFLSSWFVYGKATGTEATYPAHESDPCDPNGWYSVTKLAAEKLVRSYCQMKGQSYQILRLCNVIGNDPRATKQKNAFEWLVREVAAGRDVDLYTGDNYRCYLHVDDVCRAIRLIQEQGEPNTIYNVGSPRSERLIDLLEYVKQQTGSSSRFNLMVPPRFHQIVQVPDFWMDTRKLQGLGFVPSMTTYQAIDRILANL